MCTTCGCDDVHDHGHAHEHPPHEHPRRTVRLEQDLLAKNGVLAAENRRVLAAGRVSLFNVIGSPGAGKTALLESTIARLKDEIPLAVIEGDQATSNDAQRI